MAEDRIVKYAALFPNYFGPTCYLYYYGSQCSYIAVTRWKVLTRTNAGICFWGAGTNAVH